MLIFKIAVFVLSAILVCFSCFIQARPQVDSTVVDREIGQEPLFNNNEGSGEKFVFGEEGNSFATGQPDIDLLIEEEKIDGNFTNPMIQEEKADVKEEIFEDETNEDEEGLNEITAEIFEDEAKKGGNSIEKILIAEIEEDKGGEVKAYVDEDLEKEGSDVQQQEVKDGGKKYRKGKKKFGEGYLRHAVDLIGELRKDLRDMIPIKKFPLLPFR
ncbi:hypothetical protein JTE90_022355 [Oedothorax gibbosus]|uniref:Uncharacterized protein n=1 Tax=Oedothorax gibbosus TaxID=931172 RepID=A0AAV6VYG6_9ARAC|nr:hypothetical protein JTE90_022355 [Oedothorax gibbosus]